MTGSSAHRYGYLNDDSVRLMVEAAFSAAVTALPESGRPRPTPTTMGRPDPDNVDGELWKLDRFLRVG